MRAQVGLRKGHGEGGIGGEVERWVTLAPVSVRRVVSGERGGRVEAHLTTAMLTGAVVLARYIGVSAILSDARAKVAGGSKSQALLQKPQLVDWSFHCRKSCVGFLRAVDFPLA